MRYRSFLSVYYWRSSYLYHRYFREGNEAGVSVAFTPEEQALFAQGLQNHLEQALINLGQNERWEENNHRFFHAMSLTTYASVFGQADGTPYFEENAAVHLQHGLNVIDEILSRIVDVETGVTQEQSFNYHRLDLSLVLEVQRYIVDQGHALGRDYSELMERMLEFDLLARRPGDTITEVGDTYLGAQGGQSYINAVINAGLISPHARYVLTEGAEGERPADVIDYSEAGYVLFRPVYAWENAQDTRLLIDVSEHKVSHGHYDNTNLLLSAYGERILVDSGGPFSYDRTAEFGLDGPFRKEYFIESEAHNVLVVDGESFDADTQLVSLLDRPDFSFTTARHSGYQDITVTRSTLLIKPGLLLVFDTAENAGAQPHQFELNWHFDPKAQGVDAAARSDFRVGSAFVDAAFATGGAASYDVIQGRLGDDPQGWVTTGLYEATPAPVLEVAQSGQDAWFVSAFATSLAEAGILALEVNKTAGGFEAWVDFEGQRWFVDLESPEQVSVTALDQDTETPPPPPQAGTSDDVLTGTALADDLNGLQGNDTLSGGAGNDTLSGWTGDDSLQGGQGNDRLLGASGNDTISGDHQDDYLSGYHGTDVLFGGLGNDTLLGGNDADSLYGGSGDDLMKGDDGDDYLTAYKGNDSLNGGAGADQLWGGQQDDVLFGGQGNDFLRGDQDDDLVHGGTGDDDARGDAGHDLVTGDTGNDRLQGGDGNDTLDGGVGADLLRGGAGADLFLYSAVNESMPDNAFRDRIYDFNKAEGDKIVLTALGLSAFIGVTAFTGTGLGEVRYFQQDTGSYQRTLLEADTDGNGSADLSIQFSQVLIGFLEDDILI